MPMGDRYRRHRRRRRILSGEEFSSDELDRGEVELERVEPTSEDPPRGGSEPWGVDEPDEEQSRRLRLYREYLQSRGEGTGP
jgi:hypothetical protein